MGKAARYWHQPLDRTFPGSWSWQNLDSQRQKLFIQPVGMGRWGEDAPKGLLESTELVAVVGMVAAAWQRQHWLRDATSSRSEKWETLALTLPWHWKEHCQGNSLGMGNWSIWKWKRWPGHKEAVGLGKNIRRSSSFEEMLSRLPWNYLFLKNTGHVFLLGGEIGYIFCI